MGKTYVTDYGNLRDEFGSYVGNLKDYQHTLKERVIFSPI